MDILITGVKGQLGSRFLEVLRSGKSQLGDVPKSYNNASVKGIDIDELDLTDREAVNIFISSNKPDIVINCAALTDVDGCESEEKLAYLVNETAPMYLARACDRVGAKLVHLSTDYVFSGEGTMPLKVDCPTNPVTVYGKSKLGGEIAVRRNMDKYFIVRTAWLYGLNGNNFVKTMRRLGLRRTLRVVDDQVGSPTHVDDLVHQILLLVDTEDYGVYHVTNKGVCSWYDFAVEIIKLSKIDCVISPCTSLEFPRPAKRPAWSVLSHDKLKYVGDITRRWQDALAVFIKELDELEKE